MCFNCFPEEIKNFDTSADWLAFDLLLTQKLGGYQLAYLGFMRSRSSWEERDASVNVYQCTSCGQQWVLQEPHWQVLKSDKGFFLKRVKREKQFGFWQNLFRL